MSQTPNRPTAPVATALEQVEDAQVTLPSRPPWLPAPSLHALLAIGPDEVADQPTMLLELASEGTVDWVHEALRLARQALLITPDEQWAFTQPLGYTMNGTLIFAVSGGDRVEVEPEAGLFWCQCASGSRLWAPCAHKGAVLKWLQINGGNPSLWRRQVVLALLPPNTVRPGVVVGSLDL